LLADHLGITNGSGSKVKASNGKAQKEIDFSRLTPTCLSDTIIEKFCKVKPPITVAGIKKSGDRFVRWGGHCCIALFGRRHPGDKDASAVALCRVDGIDFPAFGKLSARKTHLVKHSVESWIWAATPEEIAAAHTVLKLEGISDLLTAASVALPGGWVAMTNSCGAKSANPAKLDFAQFKGKRIIAQGDADKPGQDGSQRFCMEFSKAGATDVRNPQLPYKIKEDHGEDFRDYVRDHSIAEYVALVEATAPVTNEQLAEWKKTKAANARTSAGNTSKDNDDEDPGRIKTLADAICIRDHFSQDTGDRFYVYKNGVYRPHGEKHVKAMVKALMTEWEDTKKWSSHLASEVVEFLRTDAPELPDQPRMDMVNVENGMVRVEDGLLLPHDPKYLSVVQLPVTYDPAAACPNIDAFVAATFPADAHNLAWEIPGLLMTPATWLQKAILLLGEGSNGKSVWLSLLVRFLGKRNVATIPLHRLETDKFVTARLVGKLANICADLPSEHLAGTSVFKQIVGGDALPAEFKFKDSFDVEPFSRLVFSANHPPRSNDSSAAFFRRWVVIPFDHTFGPDEQIPKDVLDARLQTPSELSGMLNKALDGLRRVQRQRRFSEPESTQAAWRDFHATTDPLAVWLDRCTIDGPDCIVTKQTLRVAYNAQVERDGRPAMTAKAFGQAFYKLRPNVEEKQRTVAGKFQWCYVGIGLLNQADGTPNTRDTRDSPLYIARTREGGNGEDKGGSGVESIEGDPVYPVYPVDCFHTNVAEAPTHDGYINRQCRDCGVALPCRRQEQPA
jgi:putative DNA primase/helicase